MNPSTYQNRDDILTHAVIHNGDRYHFWMSHAGSWSCRVFLKSGPYLHQSGVNNEFLLDLVTG